MRVTGTGDDFALNLSEFRSSLRKCEDLRRTDEREVLRVEEQNNILPFVVGQLDGFELSVDNGRCFELRRRERNSGCGISRRTGKSNGSGFLFPDLHSFLF